MDTINSTHAKLTYMARHWLEISRRISTRSTYVMRDSRQPDMYYQADKYLMTRCLTKAGLFTMITVPSSEWLIRHGVEVVPYIQAIYDEQQKISVAIEENSRRTDDESVL